ncbi:hypothetical protein [Bacillus sp. 1P06AnD]|uniref:hypothetical protein n=1 Tax=Bacillus sp. 1P06AnD TaxID=3132208 RepID=UPI0039A317FE
MDFYSSLEEVPVFEEEKMMKFIQKDALLQKGYRDMLNMGREKEAAMEIVFNSFVIEDDSMIQAYLSL